jgi:hypothetical protein
LTRHFPLDGSAGISPFGHVFSTSSGGSQSSG